MIDTLEKRLKQILLSPPSLELKQRIFGETDPPPRFLESLQRPIRLGWALSLAILTAVLGYGIAKYQSALAGGTQPVLEIRVVTQPGTQTHFDFTHRNTQFLSENLSTRVEVKKEYEL